ncbi:MAG: glycosyltransferase family 39 protein [Afipia sp.]|nr:glycosyltransferase family 39 protein [Afipia sp.]
MPSEDHSRLRRGPALAVLGLALLLPVLLAIIVFPTAMYDTRELIAWGREFPIVTPFHPPMMVWIGGIVDRLFGTSAAVMILTGQLLIAVGLVYFYRTLRLATTRDNALLFTFLYGTSSYTIFAPLSFALNADILQLTSWPAVVFHFLRAVQSNRMRDWIAFGFWSAVAVLTKYNAVVLFFGMASSILLLPACRQVLKRPGFYAAIATGVVLILPHIVAVLRHSAAFEYGLDHFDFQNPLSQRLAGVAELLAGYLTFAIPGYLIIAIGLWKGFLKIHVPEPDQSSASRFLLFTTVSAHIALVVLVMITGLNFLARFAAPYIMLTFLAVAPLMEWSERGKSWVKRSVVPFIAGLYLVAGIAVAVVFTTFASHSAMQEPTAEAARLILKDWDSKYTCGPAYFVGGRQTTYGVGIEAGRNVTALAYREIAGATWYDDNKLRKGGAVVMDTDPEFKERMARFLPGKTYSAESRVTIPLKRTWTGKQFTFPYRFIVPQGCLH